MPARTYADQGIGDEAGTRGDRAVVAALSTELLACTEGLLPAACPRSSPPCPPSRMPENLKEINESPMSPGVPGTKVQDPGHQGFEREAFEERAAIMEFDGGMSRNEAEAAARVLLGLTA